MGEILKRYQSGEIILASEFNTSEGLKTFGSVVWPNWEHDLATAQEHLFDCDVSWKKVHPIPQELTPEQEHLLRPTDPKARTKFVAPPQMSESAQRFIDEQRLKEVRKQLKNVKL